MNRRQRRMALVASLLLGVALLGIIGARVFEQNLMYFHSASELLAGAADGQRRVRFGGLVVPGSVQREAGNIEVQFSLADCESSVPVRFSGILPDLFREGQGIVATGQYQQGQFVADEVLAKHDENYMPPELAKALGDESGKHSCTPFKSLENA